MSTTQEDYFGTSIDGDAPQRRQKHRHRKHSKPRSYTPSDSEEEVPVREIVHEEREYKKPGRRHRYHEVVDTTYEPQVDTDTEGAGTDDEKKRRRKHRHRRRERVPDDASSTIAETESATDPDERGSGRGASSGDRIKDRAKNMGESAIAALGLEDTYKRARSKSRGRKPSMESDEGYDSNSERHRSRSSSKMNSNTAQAAMIAAAVEAFRARKEPGGVTGSKSLKRVVEAAVASGAVEKFLDRKGEDDKKSNKRIAESVLAGLAAQRGLNGRRTKRRGHDDERANPLKDLAASGLIAAAGKKFLDYQRSRSQSRPRDRSDSTSPERPGLNRRRSRSMSEALGAMGLGGLAVERFGRSRHDNRVSKNSRRSSSIRDGSSSDSSLSDSDLSLDEETEMERRKKLHRKEIISVALAILATLHLGHVAYEAREKRVTRKEKLESGKITEEEADKLRNKAILKDATAVGLAIFAAAEAVKAFKGMKESRHQFREFKDKHEQIEEHRRKKAIQQGSQDNHTPSGGEASKYYSQPGYMGPPPGATVASGYPYYPTSGPIPNTYAPRDPYSRDRRDIPVVYPSSVTHA